MFAGSVNPFILGGCAKCGQQDQAPNSSSVLLLIELATFTPLTVRSLLGEELRHMTIDHDVVSSDLDIIIGLGSA